MSFVSIEGIDGSGKSVQVKRLVEHLRAEGRNVVQTKEPDGGRLGKEIRAILTQGDRQLERVEELLLVNAARYDHVRSVISPALARGDWVVSDRYFDSTYALQVFGAAADLSPLLDAVLSAVVGDARPHATIILDLPHDRAAGRRKIREDGAGDPAEDRRNFAQIADGFRSAATNDPARCHLVNADRTEEEVAADIWLKISTLL
ncbi:thymidylate kinase [Hoeflea sp. BAL378]|uniref:dTMP kinase n=1 Tax=Hoeflea sp. BAL378 TaxID=1547437 RepID=UPI0005132B4D|nr:dTMP kinase [Hoeflea sp. BAL378]KGF71025.1 thymidylate kinase [Hoeflea sp. BAL378]